MSLLNLSDNVVVPMGMRVIVRKDDDTQKTRGGIILPDGAGIPTITARVVGISEKVSHDTDYPIREYDKVLVNPCRAIPVSFEGDNKLYVIPVEDVVAVIQRKDALEE